MLKRLNTTSCRFVCVCVYHSILLFLERGMDCSDLSLSSGMFILFVLEVNLSCEIHCLGSWNWASINFQKWPYTSALSNQLSTLTCLTFKVEMYNMIAFECRYMCYIQITDVTYDSYYSYDSPHKTMYLRRF